MNKFLYKNQNKIRVCTIVLLILGLIISLVVTTYSWIQRQWSPYIEQNGNIAVETSGSIIFQLDKGGSATSTTITTYYGVDNIELKPVSSVTGKPNTFFKLGYSESTDDDELSPIYMSLVNPDNSNESNSDFAHRNGYIHIGLYILASTPINSGAQYNEIYLDPESIITAFDSQDHSGSAHTIRVAVTVDGEKTYLFRSNETDENGNLIIENGKAKVDKHYGVIDTKTNGIFDAEGKNYFIDIVNSTVDPQYIAESDKAESLNDYMLYVDENGIKIEDANHPTKPLFSIYKNRVHLDILIWSEGNDQYCSEEIIGKQIKLLLKFVSYCPDNKSGDN